jgi:hypothetical protein
MDCFSDLGNYFKVLIEIMLFDLVSIHNVDVLIYRTKIIKQLLLICTDKA